MVYTESEVGKTQKGIDPTSMRSALKFKTSSYTGDSCWHEVSNRRQVCKRLRLPGLPRYSWCISCSSLILLDVRRSLRRCLPQTICWVCVCWFSGPRRARRAKAGPLRSLLAQPATERRYGGALQCFVVCLCLYEFQKDLY